MGIQRLEIQGFRSLKNVTWEPGRLNLLVGPNGGGKSNVLRALEMISAAAAGKLDDWIRRAGGIVPLTWDYQSDRLSWNLLIDPRDVNLQDAGRALRFQLELKRIGRSGHEITTEDVCRFNPEYGDKQVHVLGYNRLNQSAEIAGENGTMTTWSQASREHPDGFEPRESLLSQPIDTRNWVWKSAKRSLSGWRIHQEFSTMRASELRGPVTTQFAPQLENDGTNLVSVLHTLYTNSREFKSIIDEGMQAGFGQEFVGLVFAPAATGLTELAVQWTSATSPHAARDLSDGTLRFLFLLTALANPESPDLIAIDEPDVGLHPSMLPIIAEYASRASKRTQVILTTHSPEFLDAFTDLNPTVTLCHWEDGETSLHTLTPETLRQWLAKYRLGKMFTSGDLETLTLPPVDTNEELEAELDAIPPQT